jgi:hypothetical protein
MKTRTEMKPKDLWRRATLLRRLLLLTLKIEVWKKEEARRRLGFLEYLCSKRCIRGACCCQGLWS